MDHRRCAFFETRFNQCVITNLYPDDIARNTAPVDFEFRREGKIYDFIFDKEYFDIQVRASKQGSKIAARRVALMVKIMLVHGASL